MSWVPSATWENGLNFIEALIGIGTVVSVWYFWRRKKRRMYYENLNYCEQMRLHLTNFETDEYDIFNYDNDERGTVSVHNIKEIKDAKKTSFKQFKTFLVPYIEMANAWKKDGLEFDLITLRYNDEFIKINELCIIKYASENQRLKNDIKYLKELIDKIISCDNDYS